jgi:hypothetical protein
VLGATDFDDLACPADRPGILRGDRVMVEFSDGVDVREAEKVAELAPYIEVALASKDYMQSLTVLEMKEGPLASVAKCCSQVSELANFEGP